MTVRIVCVVEGHGEQCAVPPLLARIAREIAPDVNLAMQEPIRVMRDRFLNRPSEFERMMSLAAAKSGPGGRVLVLLDSEGGCPKHKAPPLLERIRRACPRNTCGLVLAHPEFETWFLAAASSIAGCQGLPPVLQPPADAESVRGAKEWLRKQMPPARRYSETIDQPALARRMDLKLARSNPSFGKLWREMELLLL